MSQRRDDARRHEPYVELISASLAGDLSRAESEQLAAHLADCADCRATMNAFREGRRLVSGLRHMPVPRNLHARVRVGIERGAHGAVPWWRRPAAAIAGITGAAAVVAGAMLALVLLNGGGDRDVGRETVEPVPTLAPTPTVEPATTPEPTVAPTPPPPTPTPVPTPPYAIGSGGINFMAVTGETPDEQILTLEGYDPRTGDETDERPLLMMNEQPEDEISGPPVAVALSPTWDWLAYQTHLGDEGKNEVWAVYLPGGEEHRLGETPDDSPFSRRMTWSQNGDYLAYTADAEDGSGPDVYVFDTATKDAVQLTETGATYAASFAGDDEGTSRLWISTADERPISYLVDLAHDEELPERRDPAELAPDEQTHEDLFQPILSPDGEYAIWWRGSMERPEPGEGWRIATGGMLYLSGEPVEGGPSLSGEPIFADLTPIGRDALGSAQVAWSFDSNSFALWQVQWRGVAREGGDGAPFPSEREIYIGQARERQLIAASDDEWHLTVGDPESSEPWDVAFVGPDLETIAVTLLVSDDGGGERPASSRLILLRARGDGDEMAELGGEARWAGPAFYVRQGTEGPQ